MNARTLTRVALLVLSLAAGALGACGGNDGEGVNDVRAEDAGTTTAAGPATTAPPTDDQRRSCTADATTSSPATFEEEEGQYAAQSVESAGTRLTFDVVQWLSGEDAAKAYAEDNPSDDEGPPNDYYIVNESTQKRTHELAEGATVALVRLAEDGDADLDPGTVEELPAYLEKAGDEAVFWLTFDNGDITDVCEQYRP